MDAFKPYVDVWTLASSVGPFTTTIFRAPVTSLKPDEVATEQMTMKERCDTATGIGVAVHAHVRRAYCSYWNFSLSWLSFRCAAFPERSPGVPSRKPKQVCRSAYFSSRGDRRLCDESLNENNVFIDNIIYHVQAGRIARHDDGQISYGADASRAGGPPAARIPRERYSRGQSALQPLSQGSALV